MQDASKSSQVEAKSLFKYLMTLGQEIPLEHKFSVEAHYKYVLPLQSPQDPQTQMDQRNSRVQALTPSESLTLPRISAHFTQNIMPHFTQNISFISFQKSIMKTLQQRKGNSGLNKAIQDFSEFLL